MIDFFLHIDRHLEELIRTHGPGVYWIVFAVIACETGLVVTPFLPGDSLLFAMGVLSHGKLNIGLVFGTVMVAALLGDNVNYWIGRKFGARLFRNEKSKIFKRENLDKTHEFFERYGGKTIIIARFVPIVRTFAPFVAGMGHMEYRRFLTYSVGAALLWVVVCVGAGYGFGSIPIVRENFSVAVLGMIAVSLIPAFMEYAKHRKRTAAKTAAVDLEARELALGLDGQEAQESNGGV